VRNLEQTILDDFFEPKVTPSPSIYERMQRKDWDRSYHSDECSYVGYALCDEEYVLDGEDAKFLWTDFI